MKIKSVFIIILTGILSMAGSARIDAKKNRCDLIVKSLSAPSSADAGSIIRIVSKVKNRGKKKAKRSYITFYLSADGSYDPSEDEYLGRVKVSSLKKKKTSKKYKKYVSIPSYVLAGTYYIIAMADGTEKIKENSEKNNYRKISINIIHNPYIGDFTAEGTYTYNSGDGALSLNITTSEFKDCGPETGTLELTVSSLTATTMVWGDPGDDDSTTWTRDSGSEGDIVGEWSMSEGGNLYTLTLNADETLTVLGNIVNCGPITVRNKSIFIDGDFSDWQEDDRVYKDVDGPECDASGQDIQEVYVAQDDEYIYLRFVLSGPLDETFGYKFGDSYRNIYVSRDSGGGYIFYANGFGLPQPWLPDDFVQVAGNQFEARFYKSDVKGFWENKELSAWCDQGRETVCRDHVSLRELVFFWL